MKPLTLIPLGIALDFLSKRTIAAIFSAVLLLGSLGAVAVTGLNFGIDFRGGILIEVRTTDGPADIGAMRSTLDGLGLGEVALQEFGAETDVLVRVQRQEGDEAEQAAAVTAVQDALDGLLGTDGWENRRTEFVGPTVGQELIEAGTLAVVLAIVGILAYIAFRFHWRYGLCAVAALTHDVIATLGLFALLQLEFNLASIAALLTIAGYSINDTVVVFDRVRENFRRYKKASVFEVLNRSLNETLSRTVVTSLTTLLALAALFFLGGAVIRDFAGAMIFGVVIGTYSSIFVAVPLLLFLRVRPGEAGGAAPETEGDAAAGKA